MGDGIGDFAFWLAMGLAALGLTFGPISQALARWIESHSRRPREDRDLVARLDARVAELEGVSQRLLELEERLDFAERILVQNRLAPPRANTPPEPVDAAG